MKKYNNYRKLTLIMKLENLYRKLFSTRLRRIVFNSIIAFAGGIFISWGVLCIASNVNVEKGVGGFETSVPAEYVEENPEQPGSVSENSIVSAAEKNMQKSEAAASGELSDDAFAELDELALIDSLSENSEPAGNSSSPEVLNKDSYSSEGLELCYFTYRVQKGDMIGFIADKFNVTQDTIISVNNIHQSRLIQIGQILKIPSMPGIVYTVKKNGETADSIAEKFEISAEKLARVNNIQENQSLVAGQTLFAPDALLDWVTRQEINGDLFHKPIHSRYYLSSYYGWRSSPFSGKRSYHSGIDMACPQGTPVYAALGGTVTSVGYNSVYGNYVIITHHSGYKTLYGHMSKQLVARGKWVDTNTRIGLVGSTGLSTGPHLHFTVYKFGKTVNPAALWK